MASNAKFCSQCASPLPEPNPPFCSQCGTAVKPNDVQPTVPSPPTRTSRSSNKPLPGWINSGSKEPNTRQSFFKFMIKFVGIVVGAFILIVIAFSCLVSSCEPTTLNTSYINEDLPEARVWDVALSDEANLRTQLEQALGDTNRGVPRIDMLSIYERPTSSGSVNAIAITVAIKQGGSSNADIREDITEILRVVDKSPINDYKELYVNVTKHRCDNYGNCGEKNFEHKAYYKTTIDRINWNNFDSFDVYDIADYIPID